MVKQEVKERVLQEVATKVEAEVKTTILKTEEKKLKECVTLWG